MIDMIHPCEQATTALGGGGCGRVGAILLDAGLRVQTRARIGSKMTDANATQTATSL